MSLILDALNRADRERSEQQQTPNLHAAPIPATASGLPITRWLLEALLVILLIVILSYMVFFRQHGGNVSHKNLNELQQQAVQEVAAGVSVSTQTLAVNEVVQPTSRSQQAANLQRSFSTPKPEGSATQGLAKPESQPIKDKAAITQLYQQKPTKTAPEDNITAATSTGKTVKPKENPAPKKERRKPTGLEILQQIPLLTTLSNRFQQSIPSIDYNAHLYNEQDNSGVVKLNGSLQKIGAEVAPGLRIIAILPDSIVLSYNGVQFRLLALNSWINYN